MSSKVWWVTGLWFCGDFSAAAQWHRGRRVWSVSEGSCRCRRVARDAVSGLRLRGRISGQRAVGRDVLGGYSRKLRRRGSEAEIDGQA